MQALRDKPQTRLSAVETPTLAPPEARKATEAPAATEAGQGAKPSRGGPSRKAMILGLVLTAAVGGAGFYGYRWATVGRFTVSTDDAYVRADNTTLAAKVPGYVASIAVGDNTYVRAGDVIATLDDGDYRLAVASARDKLASQEATVARIGRQIDAQKAAIEQADAQLASQTAGQKKAQSDFDRQQALSLKDFASKQTFEQAQAARDQAIAAVQNARAGVDAAHANVDVLKAQQQEASRGADELKTAVTKAERDLSFAVIRAPIDGVVGNRAVQTGDFVQTGQRLASVVPLDDVYIDANLKETQLTRLRAGQKVEVTVDALPDRTIEGTVSSLAPASGSVFSLLPADNATGNFTKIVQRVPVRIRVPADVAGERLLRPGMSVVVRINTKTSSVADNGAVPPIRAASSAAVR
ncbi:MAG: multidrug resistance efflux pump [Xanthobacteraceae bacterium]|nr:multidrug resistance efflux pump [Xanthobacteraceae bacterium]